LCVFYYTTGGQTFKQPAIQAYIHIPLNRHNAVTVKGQAAIEHINGNEKVTH